MFTTVLSSTVAMMALLSADTTYTVDPATSVFAVVTHKAGAAAVFAHNHFIYPGSVQVDASMPEKDIGRAQFHVRFKVAELKIDDPEAQAKYYPALHDAGIMEKPFTSISDKDVALVREHMLDQDQLDAQEFPEIEAKLVRLEKKPVTMGETQFAYEAVMALTVRGKTVEHPFGLNITEEEGCYRIEGVGRYKFTDFGFKPYSGLMGTVRNQDTFYIYVNFTAEPAQATSEGPAAK